MIHYLAGEYCLGFTDGYTLIEQKKEAVAQNPEFADDYDYSDIKGIVLHLYLGFIL